MKFNTLLSSILGTLLLASVVHCDSIDKPIVADVSTTVKGRPHRLPRLKLIEHSTRTSHFNATRHRHPTAGHTPKDQAPSPPSVPSAAIPWHLLRITQHLNPDFNRTTVPLPESGGANVPIYILSSGVNASTPDIAGSIGTSVSFVPHEKVDSFNVDGTALAGIIVSKAYGVAKKATIHSYKIATIGMQADPVWIGHALDRIAADAKAAAAAGTMRTPWIVTMVMKTDVSKVFEQEFRRLYEANVLVILGTELDDPANCRSGTEMASTGLVVTATTQRDSLWLWSMDGGCIHFLAPGEYIPTLMPDNSYQDVSDTALSAAITAGVAALYLSENQYKTIDELVTAMQSQATILPDDAIPAGTTHALVYTLSDAAATAK